MIRRARWAAVMLLLLAAPHAAQAHGSVAGLGNFIGGLFHPVVEPAHLISMLALGLLLGQRRLRENRWAPPGLACGAGAGCGAAAFGRGVVADAPLLLASGLAGLGVAAAMRLPSLLAAGVAALMALGIGLGSAPEAGGTGARAVMLLGTALGIVWWTVDVALITAELERPWLKLLVRVVASWVTACAMLVLALWSIGRPVVPV